MELHQLKADEIRGYDADRRRGVLVDIRKALVDIRMSVYSSKSQQTAKIRGLKRSLARVLTIANAHGKKRK